MPRSELSILSPEFSPEFPRPRNSPGIPLSPEFPPRNSPLSPEFPHGALAGLANGASPTYAMLKAAGAASSWPLETWAADMLLTCQVGEQFGDDRDGRVHYFLERRSGPIGAALAASITLPD